MGNLLDRIRVLKQSAEAEQEQSFESEAQEFERIAIRDLLGKATKKDAERLDVLMESLGRTEDDYTDILEALKSVAVLAAKSEFYHQAMDGLEERVEKANEQRQLLENLSRRLFEPSGAVAWVSGQASRVRDAIANTKNKVPFIFGEDGNPNASLRPLIEKELDRQAEIWKRRTAEADQVMEDTEFFERAKVLASQ
jgi:hypothetical protein